ncbi:hypothetical protein [Silvibacterium dinghuense]|nr:hypothetical protein [Silvibacterium dinghuense]GGG95175.1 hypothetical protein GCM10011586_07730 [Silvibacterium dinghuense]
MLKQTDIEFFRTAGKLLMIMSVLVAEMAVVLGILIAALAFAWEHAKHI